MRRIIEQKKPIYIQDGIKIYLESDHYSDSFGKQWKLFSKTQIDNSENSHSYQRFFNETGLKKKEFDNKNVLEVGSGAGRFTNIMLKYTNANIYSVDSSNSVFSNKDNNLKYLKERLKIYKASIMELPFKKNQFDIVICIGVLQHTPDISKTIKCLSVQVKKGGLLVIDFYPYNGFWSLISAKYMLRPFTKNMSVEKLYNFYKGKITFFINLYFFLEKLNLGILNRFIPIADISRTIPKNINQELLREMVLLDTIDMLSPKYDKPQKINTIKKLVSNENFSVIFADKIKYSSFTSTVVRGIKN